jgi:hypothetical protein
VKTFGSILALRDISIGIPGNIYICAVKHKRAFSLFLISLTLLTFMQFVSYFGFGANVHPEPSKAQFVADSQEVPHEFREIHELGVSDKNQPDANPVFQKYAPFDLGTLPCKRCESFLRECLLKSPSEQRFIAFGALIL